MKKYLITFFLIFLGVCALYSQEVISAAGETQSNSVYEVSWTVGESVIQTLTSENYKLTQGFHQSKLIITAIDGIVYGENIITVFPNPTHQFAIVKFNQIPEGELYKIFDLSGKVLESKKINSTKTQIDLTHFTNGAYLLKIIHKNNQALQTFKIIKQ